MMSVNVLSAIATIVKSPIRELKSFYTSRNRANNMGDALENYIMDVFANTLDETNEQRRLEIIDQIFSYKGNQNNPPDMIVRQGDAIEVKKIENSGAALPLNSSYPKAKLYSCSPMITKTCRSCEDWKEKDILYSVGVVNDEHLTKLFFVYGIDYAASAEIYERIRTVISSGIEEITDVELAETKELGRVNRVDPLGITYLRIRGMWHIENPAKVFSYVYTPVDNSFEFTAVINNDKYDSFPSNDRLVLEKMVDGCFNISDVKIKTPDNPAVLKGAKLITYSR
jgi:hypothetical protein